VYTILQGRQNNAPIKPDHFRKTEKMEMCYSASRSEGTATHETGSAAARTLCVLAPLMSSCSISLFHHIAQGMVPKP